MIAHRVVESGADLSDELQCVAVVYPENERAHGVAQSALSSDPAADHGLLVMNVLDLHPVPRTPTGLVGTGQAFGDDSLEAKVAGHREKLRTTTDLWRRHLPLRAIGEHLRQGFPALDIRLEQKRTAVTR